MKYLELFENFENEEIDYDLVRDELKRHGWGDFPHIRFYEFEESDYYTGTTDNYKYADEMNSYMHDISTGDFDDEDESLYIDDEDEDSQIDFQSNENLLILESKNRPTNPSLWAQCKAWAKSKYDVWPSAYACGAAAKRYKSKGGKWKKKKSK